LDPKKRSPSGARDALLRVVSFTTSDETLDDFNNIPRPTIASANREPLRTPSIQSPQVDQGSFPWAKALHASPPQAMRQLSAIPDTESYSEDLFPRSEDSNKDWFSIGAQTPSMASLLESSLSTSMKSLTINRPAKKSFPLRADLTPISGSLPIDMAKPKPLPSMASIFGRKHDMVSKSWSDLWDEEIEEEAHETELKERQAQNARTWSHESKKDDGAMVRREGLSEPKGSSFVNIRSKSPEGTVVNDIDSDTVNDGFFFQDTPPARQYSPPRYSPPSKRTTFDKWAALGDRRRAYAGASTSERSSESWRGRRNLGNSSTGFGAGVWDNKANGKSKECPWGRDREHVPAQQPHHRQELGATDPFSCDLEWVGGWQDFA